MFNIGWSEMLVVAAVALIVVGPKDLPAMLRQLGRAFATIRRMGNEFKAEVNKVAALDEVKDIKKSITEPLKQTHEELTNQFNLADENGVRPSGALKPKQEGVESVADEIREAVGMEPEKPKTDAPKPNAAAESMKAAIAAAQAKQAEKRAKEAEAAKAAEAEAAKATPKPKAPAKRTRKPASTAKKPVAKAASAKAPARSTRSKAAAAKDSAATKAAGASKTTRKPATKTASKPAAKTTPRKTAAKKTTAAAKKATTANSGDAS